MIEVAEHRLHACEGPVIEHLRPQPRGDVIEQLHKIAKKPWINPAVIERFSMNQHARLSCLGHARGLPGESHTCDNIYRNCSEVHATRRVRTVFSRLHCLASKPGRATIARTYQSKFEVQPNSFRLS